MCLLRRLPAAAVDPEALGDQVQGRKSALSGDACSIWRDKQVDMRVRAFASQLQPFAA